MSADKLDPRLSFNQVPETYDRARPEYPADAFKAILGYLRLKRDTESPIVVEIGPGTGQATKGLLALGARVTTVEIGPQLAAFMRQKFARDERVTVVNNSFEDVELPAGAHDVVFAATSFHWVDPAVRVRKAVELLAPNGVLATISTIQISSEVDRGYFDRTFPIYKKYRPSEQYAAAPTEEEAVPSDFEEFRSSGLLEDVAVKRYRWDQTYTTDAYEQLVRSYSNTQTMEPSPREDLISDLRTVIDSEYGGIVVRPLVIALTLGRRK